MEQLQNLALNRGQVCDERVRPLASAQVVALDGVEDVEHASCCGCATGTALGIKRQRSGAGLGQRTSQLAFQQCLDQQHKEVNTQQGLNATDALQVHGCHFEVCFELREPFFDQRLTLISPAQLFGGHFEVVGNQRKHAVGGSVLSDGRYVHLERETEACGDALHILRGVCRSTTPSLFEVAEFELVDFHVDPALGLALLEHLLDSFCDTGSLMEAG